MTDMVKGVCKIVFVLSFVIALSASYRQAPKATPGTLALDTLNGLEMVDTKAEVVNYRGRPAVHLLPLPNQPKDYSMLAMVSGTDFKDGTIEIDVAGSPRKDADPTDRGFIGVAFRSQGGGNRAEYFYLRPTNGRPGHHVRPRRSQRA